MNTIANVRLKRYWRSLGSNVLTLASYREVLDTKAYGCGRGYKAAFIYRGRRW